MSKDADQARHDEQLSVVEFLLLSAKFLRLFHVVRKKAVEQVFGTV